jgi:hypothetical protein
MANIKSLERSTNKWERQSASSTPEYEAGIKSPKTDWQKAASDAEANYTAGVQAAIQRKAFGKGVNKAGSAKWQNQALTKGVQRWAQGISLSKDAYTAGFGPYREVIQRTNLPPRGPKGSPQNITRVAVMAAALHDEKMKRQASGT